MAKVLIIAGVILIGIGVLIWLGVPLGKLPGDIHFKSEKTQVYIPITTSILLSLALSLLFWLLRK
jgi:acyl-[acyl carrier protein]--UDP-N-acetylglucosamine O-acyltransferase